jgi:hypothetical protein
MKLWDRVHSESLSGDAALDAANDLFPVQATEQIASTAGGRTGLLALADQLLTELMTASPTEIHIARAELNDVRIWLGALLDDRSGASQKLRVRFRAKRQTARPPVERVAVSPGVEVSGKPGNESAEPGRNPDR